MDITSVSLLITSLFHSFSILCLFLNYNKLDKRIDSMNETITNLQKEKTIQSYPLAYMV